MDRLARVIRPPIPAGRRVVAVSDVHGNLPFLKGALAAAGFTRDDVLVIVGDLLEKGAQSLDTLRYVMELQRDHAVYTLCGNCDHIDQVLLKDRADPEDGCCAQIRQRHGADKRCGADEALWPVLQSWRARSVLFQMAQEAGLPLPDGPEDLPALRRALRERFPEETDFLLNLPHILECGNFIFVHGGIPREERLEELDAYACMKNDNFMGQGRSFHRWVVVGHWPVTLYDPHLQRSAPLVDPARRIVSIDGGCVLKADGQLNALIIPDLYRDEMTWTWYDGFPLLTALDSQEPSSDPVNIRWSDSVVEVLREEGDCALVRHPTTGRKLWLPQGFISVWRDGLTHTEDATDYRLSVSPGDRLSLVLTTDRGLLVKKDGITGWYHGKIKYSG